jgi:hypothetical protein
MSMNSYCTGWIFGLTTEVVNKQILMDTGTGSMNISQESQQKIIRLRYLTLHSLGTHIQQFTEKYSTLGSLCVTLLFILVNLLNFYWLIYL